MGQADAIQSFVLEKSLGIIYYFCEVCGLDDDDEEEELILLGVNPADCFVQHELSHNYMKLISEMLFDHLFSIYMYSTQDYQCIKILFCI